MLSAILLPVLLGLQAPPPEPLPTQAPATASENLKPLSFHSQRFNYKWDTLLPLNLEVDGLKLSTIFFNRRQVRGWFLKGADFGARAQIEVTNNSKKPRIPGFAVAVFDAEDRLLGVGNGGAKVGSVAPGTTETFDLNFSRVSERLPLGTYFYLTIELVE